MTSIFDGAEIISTYSRAQAIADGVLVEAPAGIVAEAGFKYPMAFTAAAWADAVAWNEATEARKPEYTGQDETGRLWDVLWMARLAARRSAGGDRLQFRVLRVPAEGRGVRARETTLVLHIGPGDTPEPVFTVMMVGED